ncbi:MAG: hypothetical protein WC223_13210, partial [Bacteroidales bacterium]
MKKILILIFIIFNVTAFSQDLKPTEKEALLKVIVTDFKGNPRKSEIIIFENQSTKKNITGISDKDGKFSILIPKGYKNNVKIK